MDSSEDSWAAGAREVERWWQSARAERDKLPWREERDPWRILVAEVMLAQTQASRVALRYGEVIAALPTPAVAASRSVAEYLELFAGLGYYRRALALRSSAIAIETRFSGVVPNDLGTLLELPGVGPYTARAVMAFGFQEPCGVLDTNIGRVLARAVEGRSLTHREAQCLADTLVSGRSPREFNLAMMDFGAMVCTSRSPHCAECPVQFAGECVWQRRGGEDPSRRSAATSRPQPRFQGSNREGRGRLLRAALLAPISAATVASVAGWPEDPARASKIAAALVAGGLLTWSEDGSLSVPS